MDVSSLCWQCVAINLVLLAVANGMPVLIRKLFGSRFANTIDFGMMFLDNRPLFGRSKTWRGLVSAILMTSLLAPFFGLSMTLGATFGAYAMAGDLLSSFFKRRLGYEESSRFRLLDTIPESLFPVFFLHSDLNSTMPDVIVSVMLFFTLEVTLSPLLFRLHIRKRPY